MPRCDFFYSPARWNNTCRSSRAPPRCRAPGSGYPRTSWPSEQRPRPPPPPTVSVAVFLGGGGKQAKTCIIRKIAHFVEVILSTLLSGLSYLYKPLEHVEKYGIFCSSREEQCWLLCCTQSITFVSLFAGALRIPWEIRRVFFCNECSAEIANLPCESQVVILKLLL